MSLSPPPNQILAGPTDQISKIIAAWLAAKAGRSGSPKTARAYHDTIHGFRAELQRCGYDLDSDPTNVAIAAQGWASRGKPAPATYNQRLAILSSLYSYAERRGLLSTNPIRMVERRSVQSYAAALPLDAATVRTRLENIDRTTLIGQRDYALLALFLATGRRLAEVAALRLGDLHIQGTQIQIVFQRTKGGKVLHDQIAVGTSMALLTWLRAYYGNTLANIQPEYPVWVSLARNGTRGNHLSTRAIGIICQARIGTSKVHTLRHTFAHAMEDAGAKVSEIQSRLGHTNLSTTGRYLAALRSAENPQGSTLEQLFGVTQP